MRIIKGKVYENKTNKQLSIVLPKKKLKSLKGKIPKKIKFKIEEWEW
jgi:hypothetical protein|tara:strand:+ start:485 stop:625 length:141 start_codon:yes stop_codon:yes gene_type:complete